MPNHSYFYSTESSSEDWINNKYSGPYFEFSGEFKDGYCDIRQAPTYQATPIRIAGSKPYADARDLLLKASDLVGRFSAAHSISWRELKEMSAIITRLSALHYQIGQHYGEDYHEDTRIFKALQGARKYCETYHRELAAIRQH